MRKWHRAVRPGHGYGLLGPVKVAVVVEGLGQAVCPVLDATQMNAEEGMLAMPDKSPGPSQLAVQVLGVIREDSTVRICSWEVAVTFM